MSVDSVTTTAALMWLMRHAQYGRLAPGMREADRVHAVKFVQAGLESGPPKSKVAKGITIAITNIKGTYNGQ